MQIFDIKLRIFLTWSQIDSSLFDRVMKVFSMLLKIQTNTPKKPWKFLSLCRGYFSCCFKYIALYITTWWRSSTCCKKYIDTKRFFYIWIPRGLLWARSWYLGDRNIWVGKAAWSNSKQSSWNTLSFIVMLQIWIQKGFYEVNPVGLPIEICQLAGQLGRVQKNLFERHPRIFCCLRFFMLLFFLLHLLLIFHETSLKKPSKYELFYEISYY